MALTNAPARRIGRLLVANRGEIAIRVLRAATELGISTVSIFSREDRFALHRFKADESYLVGSGRSPVQAYLDIDDIVRIALDARVDAIHPGYGFLSENPDFADAVRAAGILFVGPSSSTMRRFGNKVSARALAEEAGVPVVPASRALPADVEDATRIAEKVGFPVMLKASWGGGGRGMRVLQSAQQMRELLGTAREEAAAAFGNDELYVEKYVPRARHVEVQILGDAYGTVVQLGERDCTVQRRHQKVLEEAPPRNLASALAEGMATSALALAAAVAYDNAGTVEFLVDVDAQRYYFIEVNPRIQVEHTVTELVTGIDLVKAQIRIAEGVAIGTPDSGVPFQDGVAPRGHAMQCRITTEDPLQKFTPTYGQITAYRPATGFGVRLDGGTAYAGAVVTPFYDSLLEKVTVWAPTFEEARRRMLRALREFRIRGVTTNIAFLDALLEHEDFRAGIQTTNFLDEHPGLVDMRRHRDRATRLLGFVGEIIVNGNPEVLGRPPAEARVEPAVPEPRGGELARGTRDRLLELGPAKFAAWMKDERRALVTDTTFRDAHQSLLATRVRTRDILRIAPAYAERLPELFSIECWGGATFDVTMRFLIEDPWQRLRRLREAIPNICFQMLLRASNAVGYTAYPDNAVREFIKEAATQGIDIFRIFDSLNWLPNMKASMEAVRKTRSVCEAAVCYTGDILDPRRDKYPLEYYVRMAKELERMGAHTLAIKDMAGLVKPYAAEKLVKTLRREVGIPIHFHTHDTSGINAASVLKAADAGVHVADAAVASMSGQTSQPNLNSIVAALAHTRRASGLSLDALNQYADYWEVVREFYAPFDTGPRSGTAEVYLHEMPGGQYTNLKEQAESMGLGLRWHELARTYADVNMAFGDIVKVTPSSKVVGDMAIFLVNHNMTMAQFARLAPDHTLTLPTSVIEMFMGALGEPEGGWPKKLQEIILRGAKPNRGRPGASLPKVDLEETAAEVEKRIGRRPSHDEVLSYLMYPDVFLKFAKARQSYGDVEVLPTPAFYYGIARGQEIAVELEPGKTLAVKFLTFGESHPDGTRTVFFELNGQPREVTVRDRSLEVKEKPRRKADPARAGEIGAPIPGVVSTVAVELNQTLQKGDRLLVMEAMKMQSTVYAPAGGKVKELLVQPGLHVEAKDLLLVIE